MGELAGREVVMCSASCGESGSPGGSGGGIGEAPVCFATGRGTMAGEGTFDWPGRLPRALGLGTFSGATSALRTCTGRGWVWRGVAGEGTVFKD